jgi:hypothetical protein
MNAIVFLGLKPKNRGQTFDVLPDDEYIKLVDYCFKNNIPYGFDSCSSPKAELAISKNKNLNPETKEKVLSCCERCEANCHSFYINTDGVSFPCSFGEDIEKGVNVLEIKNFISEAWDSPDAKDWRNRLFKLKRECPMYPEIRLNARGE